MYGYVRPNKGELKVREYEQFRAIYCGLCHTLDRHCGFGARMLLSYDLCFLAMVFAGTLSCPMDACQKRCIVSPFRRRTCIAQNRALELAADCTIILAYGKAKDGVCDEKGIKKFAYRILTVLLRRKYKKSAARLPEFAAACQDGLNNLSELEKAGTDSIDRPASCFAGMLSALAGCVDAAQRRQAELLFYHIGRWVYIADAWDDVEEDLKSGNYNCIVRRFDLHSVQEKADITAQINATLAQSAQTAASAVELMQLGQWTPIIENIVYLGLPSMAAAIEQGQTRQRSKHGSL